jgi:4'-phosphopantetheinyl transferase
MSSETSCLLGARGPSPALEDSTTRVSGWVLSENEVHIWRIPLKKSSLQTLRVQRVLSADEREKAARFYFDKDRTQFVQARAALRFILGEYLQVDPQTLEFSYGLQGKPALANEHVDNSLRFNLSRREGLALLAVTRGREIGVDVELVNADLPVFEIAGTTFSDSELGTLRNLPKTMHVAGFFNCWTRKEAYVKARGEGLSFPLKQFDVSLSPGDLPMLLNVRDNPDEVDRWTLQEIPVNDSYVAALAVEGTDLNVTFRDWDWTSQDV